MRKGSAPNVIMREDRGIVGREQIVIEGAGYMHSSPGAHIKYARYSMQTAVFASMFRRALISVAIENIGGFRADREQSYNRELHLIHSCRKVHLCTGTEALYRPYSP
jgi:hypothetical protein